MPTTSSTFRTLCLLLAGGAAFSAWAQAPRKTDKAAAYYHYSLGHLYSELSQAYGGRGGDYLNKAIENYKLALRNDPSATFLSEELSDLYIQAGKIREAVIEAEEAVKQNPSDLTARRILGRIYMRMIGDSQQGRIDENMLRKSIEQYSKVVELAPKDTDAWLLLGRLHKIAQNSAESERAYKTVLEIEPENEEALTGMAMVYADLGDAKKAAELLNKAAGKSPNLRTLSALAASYEQMRDFSLAAETWKRAIQLAPGNTELKRGLAQAQLQGEQLDEALKTYEEIVADEPRDSQSHLQISRIYRQRRNFEKARESSAKARALEPGSLEIRYNDVGILEAEGKSTEAITALREILSTTQKSRYSSGERTNRVVLLERLGLMHRSIEQYKEATDVFRQIVDLDPDNAGARGMAQIIDTWRIAKDYSKAIEEANGAQKKYPNDRLVRAVRASVLAETGKPDEAAAELRKTLDGKNDRETYISLAQVYEKAKNYAEMGKAIDEAEKLSTSNEEKESLLFMRGSMFERMKKFDQAEAEFRKVLEINPTSASAMNYLGYMLADRNVRLQEALQLIQKAVDQEPNNGAYLDSLGWVYFRMDRLNDAQKHLEAAIAKYSKDPTVHDHLGDVYFKQGKLKEAISQWQSSLKEWEHASPAEVDQAEVAKVQKKLENAKVRLAKESKQIAPKQKEQQQ